MCYPLGYRSRFSQNSNISQNSRRLKKKKFSFYFFGVKKSCKNWKNEVSKKRVSDDSGSFSKNFDKSYKLIDQLFFEISCQPVAKTQR